MYLVTIIAISTANFERQIKIIKEPYHKKWRFWRTLNQARNKQKIKKKKKKNYRIVDYYYYRYYEKVLRNAGWKFEKHVHYVAPRDVKINWTSARLITLKARFVFPVIPTLFFLFTLNLIIFERRGGKLRFCPPPFNTRINRPTMTNLGAGFDVTFMEAIAEGGESENFDFFFSRRQNSGETFVLSSFPENERLSFASCYHWEKLRDVGEKNPAPKHFRIWVFIFA